MGMLVLHTSETGFERNYIQAMAYRLHAMDNSNAMLVTQYSIRPHHLSQLSIIQ